MERRILMDNSCDDILVNVLMLDVFLDHFEERAINDGMSVFLHS